MLPYTWPQLFKRWITLSIGQISMHWIVIYSVDSAIRLLNNRSLYLTMYRTRQLINPKFKIYWFSQKLTRTTQSSWVLLINSIPSSCRPSISITWAKAWVAQQSLGIISSPWGKKWGGSKLPPQQAFPKISGDWGTREQARQAEGRGRD